MPRTGSSICRRAAAWFAGPGPGWVPGEDVESTATCPSSLCGVRPHRAGPHRGAAQLLESECSTAAIRAFSSSVFAANSREAMIAPKTIAAAATAIPTRST